MPYKHNKKKKAHNKLYYQKNIDEIQSTKADSYKQNEKKILTQQKKYYEKNQKAIC